MAYIVMAYTGALDINVELNAHGDRVEPTSVLNYVFTAEPVGNITDHMHGVPVCHQPTMHSLQCTKAAVIWPGVCKVMADIVMAEIVMA